MDDAPSPAAAAHPAESAPRPLVTIVVCVYNGGAYLRPSIESALAQTYGAIEVLVIDDGSTDGCIDTIEGIDDPRLRIVRQPNQGKPAALNRALREMRGDFYAIQDADDLSHPRRIERLVARMVADPSLAAVFSGYELIIGDRVVAPRTRERSADEVRRDIERYSMPSLDPSAMYRVAHVAGMEYEPTFKVVEGYDYILRVGERHPMAVVRECLYSYRVHPESDTQSDPAVRDRRVALVLDRARERRGDPRPAEPTRPLRSRNAVLDNNLATHFLESVIDSRRAGRRREALATALRCGRLHPLDPFYWKPMAMAVVPVRAIDRLRRGPP